MVNVFQYIIMSLFNEHLYDYLAVLFIFVLGCVGLFFAIGGILRRFKYFKWWPRQITNVHPDWFTHIIPTFILLVLIYFYMLELWWEPSYRMDSYDKQWDIFKEHIMYKGISWRNKPPPHFAGKTISERDKPAIDKAHRLSENLLEIQKLNLMIEGQ